jgi:hypothetical protein
MPQAHSSDLPFCLHSFGHLNRLRPHTDGLALQSLIVVHLDLATQLHGGFDADLHVLHHMPGAKRLRYCSRTSFRCRH